MKVAERATPVAAVIAALSTLACCLPFAFLGALKSLLNPRHFRTLALVLFSLPTIAETIPQTVVTVQSAPAEPIIESRDGSHFLNFDLIVREQAEVAPF